MFGLVVSVVSLPVGRELTSLTAVRLRTEEGETAKFFADSPIAATLKAGEWIEFQAEKEWGRTPRLQQKPRLSLNGNMARDFIESVVEMARVVQASPGAVDNIPSLDELSNLAGEGYSTVQKVRRAFDLESGSPMPDELIVHLLPAQLVELARRYIAVSR